MKRAAGKRARSIRARYCDSDGPGSDLRGRRSSSAARATFRGCCSTPGFDERSVVRHFKGSEQK